MKLKQRNIKIFEFQNGSEKEIIECIKANFELINDHCLAFHNQISNELTEFLLTNKLNYINLNRQLKNPTQAIISLPKQEIPTPLESIEEKPTKPSIFLRAIRSGEEIICENDAIFFKNIHSGARIICKGNLQIFGKCEADLIVSGDFILLKEFCNARILFKEYSVEKNLLSENGSFNYIYLENATIKVDII